MPTQTAYAVPTGSSHRPGQPDHAQHDGDPNTSDGASRVNPADLPSAVAHTASSTPDTTSTAHAIENSSSAAVAHRVRHRSSGSHVRLSSTLSRPSRQPTLTPRGVQPRLTAMADTAQVATAASSKDPTVGLAAVRSLRVLLERLEALQGGKRPGPRMVVAGDRRGAPP